MHNTVYMVERAGMPGEYRKVGEANAMRLLGQGVIRMEGADGDEENNTVTYWYTRKMED